MPTSADQDTAPIVLVLTTLTADTDAMTLARTLIDERLAACVNVLPAMTSVYRWDGQVSEDREQQLLIKTSPARLAALEARLHELHPYDLPEFIVIDASASADYAAWVGENLQPLAE